jgi:hypothetical protein
MNQSGSRIPDPVYKGVETLFQEESGSDSFGQSGAIFEWGKSEFYELSCWILLVKQRGSNFFDIQKIGIKCICSHFML